MKKIGFLIFQVMKGVSKHIIRNDIWGQEQDISIYM
jgi:hypothetical protein